MLGALSRLPFSIAFCGSRIHIKSFCDSQNRFYDSQTRLWLTDESQKATRPSEIFSNSGKVSTAGRRPLAGRRSRRNPSSRTTRRIRVAVGLGMSTEARKSVVLKIGRLKNQSRARKPRGEVCRFTEPDVSELYALQYTKLTTPHAPPIPV